ncbi:MAG: hypothetical protein VW270_28690, partial [Candidatus Poseidoniales archaeon]
MTSTIGVLYAIRAYANVASTCSPAATVGSTSWVSVLESCYCISAFGFLSPSKMLNTSAELLTPIEQIGCVGHYDSDVSSMTNMQVTSMSMSMPMPMSSNTWCQTDQEYTSKIDWFDVYGMCASIRLLIISSTLYWIVHRLYCVFDCSNTAKTRLRQSNKYRVKGMMSSFASRLLFITCVLNLLCTSNAYQYGGTSWKNAHAFAAVHTDGTATAWGNSSNGGSAP